MMNLTITPTYSKSRTEYVLTVIGKVTWLVLKVCIGIPLLCAYSPFYLLTKVLGA